MKIISICLFEGSEDFLENFVNPQRVDQHSLRGLERPAVVDGVFASLFEQSAQAGVQFAGSVEQGADDTLQTLLRYQVFAPETLDFVAQIREFLLPLLPPLLLLFLAALDLVLALAQLLPQPFALCLFLLEGSHSVLLCVALESAQVGILLLQLLLGLGELLPQGCVFSPQFSVVVFQVPEVLHGSGLLVGLLPLFLLGAVGLLQYLLQHLLLLPQHLDDLPLPVQTVLELGVFLVPTPLLRSFLPTTGHLQDALLVVLDDGVLFLNFTLVVGLQFYLVLLQPQHLAGPLLRRTLHPPRLLPCLRQLLPQQLRLLLQSLVLGGQGEELGLPLETFLPVDVSGVGEGESRGVAGAAALARVEERTEFVDSLPEFQLLLAGVLLEFDFPLQQRFLVAHVAHALDEPLQSAFQLRQSLLLLPQDVYYFGAVLLVDLALQQLVLLLLQLHRVVELLVLAAHFFPHVLQQISALFPSFAHIHHAAVLPILTVLPLLALFGLQRSFLPVLQFQDASLEELYLLEMQYLAFAPVLPQFVLHLLEELHGSEDRSVFASELRLLQLVFICEIEQPAKAFLLIADVIVQFSQFPQLIVDLFLLRSHRVGFIRLVDLPALVLDAHQSARGAVPGFWHSGFAFPLEGVGLLSVVADVLQFCELFGAFLLGLVAGEVQNSVFKLDDALGHAFTFIMLFVELADGRFVDAAQLPLSLLPIPSHFLPQFGTLPFRSFGPCPQLFRLHFDRVQFNQPEGEFSLCLPEEFFPAVGFSQ